MVLFWEERVFWICILSITCTCLCLIVPYSCPRLRLFVEWKVMPWPCVCHADFQPSSPVFEPLAFIVRFVLNKATEEEFFFSVSLYLYHYFITILNSLSTCIIKSRNLVSDSSIITAFCNCVSKIY